MACVRLWPALCLTQGKPLWMYIRSVQVHIPGCFFIISFPQIEWSLQDLLYCPNLKRSILGVLKKIYFIGARRRKEAALWSLAGAKTPALVRRPFLFPFVAMTTLPKDRRICTSVARLWSLCALCLSSVNKAFLMIVPLPPFALLIHLNKAIRQDPWGVMG